MPSSQDPIFDYSDLSKPYVSRLEEIVLRDHDLLIRIATDMERLKTDVARALEEHISRDEILALKKDNVALSDRLKFAEDRLSKTERWQAFTTAGAITLNGIVWLGIYIWHYVIHP